MGTYASILGQEASQIGSAFALEKSDWIFPSFREMGVYVTMGYPIHMLFQYWSGDERGMKCPDDLNIFLLAVPVGTQVPHAVGAAMAAKYKKDKAAVICYFGDGKTSKGDFHEGFNMAGVFKLPVVFICQNNQWAISVPRENRQHQRHLRKKHLPMDLKAFRLTAMIYFLFIRLQRRPWIRQEMAEAPHSSNASRTGCLTIQQRMMQRGIV